MRSASNATYANRGMPLEKLIKLSAAAQADQGLDLDKTGQGFAATGRDGGRLVGMATTTAPLDFTGGYARANRWDTRVEIEAKSTKVPTRFNLSLLHDHQVRRLERLHGRRAVAFVLIEFRGMEPAYRALTWPVLRSWWAEWRMRDYRTVPASIPRATIEAHCPAIPVIRRGGGVRLDLVAVIEQLMAARAA